MTRPKSKGATSVGLYDCPSCKAHWENGKSSADKSQDCRKCLTQVFPKIRPASEVEKLTPYQGNSRTFGAFKCPTCEKSWMSANSWANMGQMCKDCRVNVYPHMQRPLLKAQGDQDIKKPHLDDLCEKCRKIGRSCRTIRSQGTKEHDEEEISNAFRSKVTISRKPVPI